MANDVAPLCPGLLLCEMGMMSLAWGCLVQGRYLTYLPLSKPSPQFYSYSGEISDIGAQEVFFF